MNAHKTSTIQALLKRHGGHLVSPRPYLTAALLCVAVACGGRVRDLSGSGGGAPGGSNNAAGGSMGAQATGGTSNTTPIVPAAIVGRGPFDCPTVDAPPVGIEAAAPLSGAFKMNCAVCHGGSGEGVGPYPKIPGMLSEAVFIEKVRAGSANMPKFSTDFISDDQLRNDYKLLTAPGGSSLVQSAGTNEWQWSQSQLDSAYTKGLALWRQPGTIDGQACTNCHSPDGIDLALIGYRDDAILRRAQKHVTPAEALVIRDFVHALRRRFGLKQTCSTSWRPFQPAGEVLLGNTAAERDIAFSVAMKKLNLMLFVGKVVTLDDAKKAWSELQGIHLRHLPIPTALPHWTEDRFNGPEHRSNNDYMPPLPTFPNKPADFYAKEDAYLAAPSDAGLFSLLAMQANETNDGGYSAPKNVGPAYSGCGFSGGKLTFLVDRLTYDKRASVIIAQHLFRMKVLNKPSQFDKQVPAAGTTAPPAPMWNIGQKNAEPSICGGGFNTKSPIPEVLDVLTPDMRADLSDADLKGNVLKDLSIELADPWMTVGQIFDQGFATTTPALNPFNYWASITFPHKVFFLPFLYAHRMAVKAKYWDAEGKKSGLPTHPLLDGVRAMQRKLETAAPNDELNYDGYLKTGADANRLKGNIIRMYLLLQRDLLQKGGEIFSQAKDFETWHYTKFATQMKVIVKDQAHALMLPDAALYTTGILELASEVDALLARAPIAPGERPAGGN